MHRRNGPYDHPHSLTTFPTPKDTLTFFPLVPILAILIPAGITASSSQPQVMLTVFKINTQALAFYFSIGYVVDETSPSRHDIDDAEHEILSKVVSR